MKASHWSACWNTSACSLASAIQNLERKPINSSILAPPVLRSKHPRTDETNCRLGAVQMHVHAVCFLRPSLFEVAFDSLMFKINVSQRQISTLQSSRETSSSPHKGETGNEPFNYKNTVMKNEENIWTRNSCHPNLVSPFCVHCKAPMLWTTWVPVISLRGLRSFFGAEGCITFFLGCPAGQDRTLLSMQNWLLAVCKTKMVRDRKLTKISKLNRPESGRAFWLIETRISQLENPGPCPHLCAWGHPSFENIPATRQGGPVAGLANLRCTTCFLAGSRLTEQMLRLKHKSVGLFQFWVSLVSQTSPHKQLHYLPYRDGLHIFKHGKAAGLRSIALAQGLLFLLMSFPRLLESKKGVGLPCKSCRWFWRLWYSISVSPVLRVLLYRFSLKKSYLYSDGQAAKLIAQNSNLSVW